MPLILGRGMIRSRRHGRLLSTATAFRGRRDGASSSSVSISLPGADGRSMLAKLASYTLVGIDATPVEVEVDVSFAQMPKTVLVGLAETAVKESTHRVERAIVNSGYHRAID